VSTFVFTLVRVVPILSLEKAKSQAWRCYGRARWEMDELEKGIAVFWCSRVGFSQQPDRADLLLSCIMFSTNLQWKWFLAFITVLSIKLSIGSKPSQI